LSSNKELASKPRKKKSEELVIANKELAYQNQEKEKRAKSWSLPIIVAYQNQEKEKEPKSWSLLIKLAYQNQEKVNELMMDLAIKIDFSKSRERKTSC
jgi:hypothetical protein